MQEARNIKITIITFVYRTTCRFSAIAAIFLFILTSCEKDISVEVPSTEQKIVIEGAVEQGVHPYVILTRTTGYFDSTSVAALFKLVVTNAKVTVSDGVLTDTLKLAFDTLYFPPFIYRASKMTGSIGRTYQLKIEADGKTFTSTTTIPKPVKLDSVWFQIQPKTDSLGFIWARLSEPAGLGNAYRWYAKRLHKDKRFLAPFGSVFNDKFIDGKTFNFFYNRGREPQSTAPDDVNAERGYFKMRDTVVVKFCAIPEDAYRFFVSYQTSIGSNGNPFSAPITLKTNIQGGALGVWAGYGSTLDTVICRK